MPEAHWQKPAGASGAGRRSWFSGLGAYSEGAEPGNLAARILLGESRLR